MTPDNTFTLPPLDRSIMVLFQLGSTPQQTAHELERSESCINSHIGQIRRKARVRNKAELFMWAMQTPACTERDGRCSPGLHPDQCPCGSPLCASRLRSAA